MSGVCIGTAPIGVSDDDALYFLSDRQADTKVVFPSPCIVNRGSKDQPIVLSNKKNLSRNERHESFKLFSQLHVYSSSRCVLSETTRSDMIV